MKPLLFNIYLVHPTIAVPYDNVTDEILVHIYRQIWRGSAYVRFILLIKENSRL